MKITLLFIFILVSFIHDLNCLELIMKRTFGKKIFCMDDQIINTPVLCQQICQKDSFTSSDSISSLLINGINFGYTLSIDLRNINQNYSYILVEMEYVRSSTSTGIRLLREKTNSNRNLGAIQIPQDPQPILFQDTGSMICKFQTEYEQVPIQYAESYYANPGTPLLNIEFDSFDSMNGSFDQHMLSFKITSNCVLNCKECSSPTSCAVCLDGFRIFKQDLTSDNMCEEVGQNQIPDCLTVTTEFKMATCRSCVAGFTLDSVNNVCNLNTSPDISCAAGSEYLENGKCNTYAAKAYYESTVISNTRVLITASGNYTEIINLTPLQIQTNYRCQQGTVVIINRQSNFSQFTCRCLDPNCVSCSSINSCDLCNLGYTYDSQAALCVLPPFTQNSFKVEQVLTDQGYDIRAKFAYSLVNSQVVSQDVMVSITGFSSFQVGQIFIEDFSTILFKIEMQAQAKNKNLTVKFTNSQFVSDNLLASPEASIQLDPYLQISDSDKQAAENAKSIGQAASGAIVGTLLIIVIISNFSAIVATIDLTGFLYYLLYIEARFPVNIVSFYAVFKNFQMDFIPNPFTDMVTPGYMQLSTVRFMQSDTDGYFLVSTGQSVIIFLLIVIMYLTAKVLSKLDIPFISNYFKKSVYETWEFGGYFDAVWTVYLYVLIGVMMQFQSFDCSDTSCGWNYFIFSISFIVSFGLPALIVKLIRDNPNIKEDEYKRTKLSSIIAGVRLYSQNEQNQVLKGENSQFSIWRDKYSKKLSKYYMPILYLRKILFGFIIVCLNSSGYAQLILITLLNLVMTAYFILLKPLDSNYENYKGAISEIVMVVFQILVGILIDDPETQEETDRINIGWVAIAIVSLVILWHTSGIIFDFILAMWAALKAMVQKRNKAKTQVHPISQEELKDLDSAKFKDDQNLMQTPNKKNGDIEGPVNDNNGESYSEQQSSDLLNQSRKKTINLQQAFTTRQSTLIKSYSKIDESSSPLQKRN